MLPRVRLLLRLVAAYHVSTATCRRAVVAARSDGAETERAFNESSTPGAPFSSAAKTSDARSANGCAHRRLKLQRAALHQRAFNPFQRRLAAPFESRYVCDTAAAVAETRHCLCAVLTASAPLGAVTLGS